MADMTQKPLVTARDVKRIEASGWRRDLEWETALIAHWQDWGGSPFPVAFKHDRLKLAALLGREPYPGEVDLRWHISVSCPDDVPPWSSLAKAGHDLRPGVAFCIGVPPRSMWVNLHPNVLHLHELRDQPLIASFRENAKGHTPS